MFWRPLLFALTLAAPLRAEPVADYILPATDRFATATAALSATAASTCDPALLRPAWEAAMDAFLAVQFLRLGPVEAEGRALALSFWPDPKATGARQTAALLAAEDPAALTPAGMAAQSVAVRGLTGTERLIFADPPLTGTYPCALIAATAADLDATAQAIRAEWPAFATLLSTAGQPGNTTFLSQAEAQQALFTQLITGIEFLKDTRIARPLGTFDAPMPQRAEGRLSGRAGANIAGSLIALRAYALALDPAASQTAAAFDAALAAAALPDPTLQDLADPSAWLKLDILRQRVDAAGDVARDEIGGRLGVSIGFNAADGD